MPVTLMKTTSALTLAQKSAQASTFITAGSCSVMLSWPTRRMRRCQGRLEFDAAVCADSAACVSSATIFPAATAPIPSRDATGKMLTPAFSRSRRFIPCLPDRFRDIVHRALTEASGDFLARLLADDSEVAG